MPPENVDAGTAVNEFPRSPEVEIEIFPADQVAPQVLGNIGVAHRTDEDVVTFDEVAAQITPDLE